MVVIKDQSFKIAEHYWKVKFDSSKPILQLCDLSFSYNSYFVH